MDKKSRKIWSTCSRNQQEAKALRLLAGYEQFYSQESHNLRAYPINLERVR